MPFSLEELRDMYTACMALSCETTEPARSRYLALAIKIADHPIIKGAQ